MKKLIVFALMAMFATVVMAQSEEKKEAGYNLVTEGVTLFDEGKKEEALKKFDAALKLDDTYASTYYEKAYTLIELGKNKEAKKVMEKGLKKATWGNIGMNYKLMGDILDEEGNARKAVEYYWKAYDLIDQNNQSQVQALTYNMGLAYVNLAKQEPDSCDAHRNHALGCFITSL